jgi:hypothetical protein
MFPMRTSLRLSCATRYLTGLVSCCVGTESAGEARRSALKRALSSSGGLASTPVPGSSHYGQTSSATATSSRASQRVRSAELTRMSDASSRERACFTCLTVKRRSAADATYLMPDDEAREGSACNPHSGLSSLCQGRRPTRGTR